MLLSYITIYSNNLLIVTPLSRSKGADAAAGDTSTGELVAEIGRLKASESSLQIEIAGLRIALKEAEFDTKDSLSP